MMIWIFVCLVTWLLVSSVLALVLGRSIHRAEVVELAQRVEAMRTMAQLESKHAA